jgi:hypothetical protein
MAHTACLNPQCGSSDARFVYKDGSSFCFSCRKSWRGAWNPYAYTEDTPKQAGLPLPDDASHDFPEHVVAWVAKYGITIEELIRHNCFYSASWDQLIYTWKDGEGRVVLWQGRNFRPTAKAKCFTQGTPDDVLPLYGSGLSEPGMPSYRVSQLVIVEDPVSAMKLSRYGLSMPALGSDLSPNKLARIARLPGLERVVVWLDGNMYHKAQRMAQRFLMLGVSASAIYTPEDPKACTDEVMQEMIGPNMSNV